MYFFGCVCFDKSEGSVKILNILGNIIRIMIKDRFFVVIEYLCFMVWNNICLF